MISMQKSFRSMMFGLAVSGVCAPSLHAQSVKDLLRGLVDEQIAKAEERTGMSLTGGMTVRLSQAVRASVAEGYQMSGAVQGGVVLRPTQNEIGRMFEQLLNTVNLEIAEGELVRVLFHCPSCSSFTLADGDDAARSVGQFDVPPSSPRAGVTVSSATCANTTGDGCLWYAVVMTRPR